MIDGKIPILVIGFDVDTDSEAKAALRAFTTPSPGDMTPKLRFAEHYPTTDWLPREPILGGILLDGDRVNPQATLTALREEFPQTPIVVVSSQGDLEAPMMMAGADDCVNRQHFTAEGLAMMWRVLFRGYRRGDRASNSSGIPFIGSEEDLDISHPGGDRQELETRISEQTRLIAAQHQELKRQREQIRRQHLAILESSRMKSAFLSTVSHELRTPLNVIIGFSQLLLRKKNSTLTPVQVQTLQCIFDNGKQLLSVINDIIERSKLEAGASELRPKGFNLVQLVTSVAGNARWLCEQKGLELKIETRVENPRVIQDHQGVRRVVSNLLANALKFTEEGRISVRIWEVTPERLAIAVSDTGIGIAPEHLKRIFTAFEQLDNSLARNYNGVGLGLAIVDSLVKMMKGSICVESSQGEGSTFRVELPRSVIDAHGSESREPYNFLKKRVS
ncbi:MAG: hybrid sensor histidine kinase/response regulator [Phormidium sp. BM_Day4_Bin.17]|nr:hybrid sensor histidine kinase/response regulator [Phormidium sp. BM_Day4_Bin.17]UCJ12565.1 MAG: hybrid sensor histidine kinase/response regulator [Phormidium sp. PBR-2020]